MSVIGSNMLAGSSGAVGAYQVERSLRFNSADSAYLNRTPASAGNRKTWTWSGWVKRSSLAAFQNIFSAQYVVGGSADAIRFSTTDTLALFLNDGTTAQIVTTQVFRDVSAWYHIVASVDTTQATAANRMKLYVNGSQITAFGTATYPSQNFDCGINNNVPHSLGNYITSPSQYLNGYLADVNFIDGQALDPTSFAETDATTGQWIPKAYTGTYGTNGFYLKFADNSGVTATTLGKDSSGNGNNFTPNNFSVTAGSGNDSLVDSPTNYGTDTGAGGEVRGNYCTLNPIAASAISNNSYTLTNGNLDSTGTSSTYYGFLSGTIEFDSGTSTGFYWEYTQTTYGSAGTHVGIYNSANFGSGMLPANSFMGGAVTNTFGVTYRNDGYIGNLGTATSGFTTWTSANDVIGIAVKENKIWFSKNGTWISGNPSTGTSPSVTLPSSRMVVPVVGMILNAVGSINFGQRPFAYTAPSGYKALCTQNLPAPAVVKSNTAFNVVTYTGNGSNPRSITGVGFQPDFVWGKTRSQIRQHTVFDAVRGAGSTKVLIPSATDAEGGATGNESSLYGYISAFGSDGFTVSAGSTNNNYWNANGDTYAAWTWKANGAGSSNTAGSITSTVSANTAAGVSVVTYTGNGVVNASIGHGLGVAPKFIITKCRSSATDWVVNTNASGTWTYSFLNTTAALTADTVNVPTSSLFYRGSANTVNGNGLTYVSYCFAEVPGFSKFGSYTGNGSADGPFVHCGFRPRFIMIKRTDTTGDWNMIDTARDPNNVVNTYIYANSSAAEGTYAGYDILSNGFKLRNTGANINASGGTFIFMAFAESPFNYARAR